MKNSHTQICASPFLSAPTRSSEPTETPNALLNHQLKKTQNLFDGLFNYLCYTNDNIIEIVNQLERNRSMAEMLVETLKNEKLHDDKSQNNDFSKTLIKEKALLGKRPNPFLGVLDKESLFLGSTEDESSEAESNSEGFEEDLENDSLGSLDSEGYDADFETPGDTEPRSSQDQQAQTSPVIPVQNDFSWNPQYFHGFSLPVNSREDQNANDDNKLEPQQERELSLPIIQGSGSHGPLILRQQVFLVQPLQIMTSLVNEVEESES